MEPCGSHAGATRDGHRSQVPPHPGDGGATLCPSGGGGKTLWALRPTPHGVSTGSLGRVRLEGAQPGLVLWNHLEPRRGRQWGAGVPSPTWGRGSHGGWLGLPVTELRVAVWSPQRCLCSILRRTLKCQALEGVGGEREGSVPARTFRHPDTAQPAQPGPRARGQDHSGAWNPSAGPARQREAGRAVSVWPISKACPPSGLQGAELTLGGDVPIPHTAPRTPGPSRHSISKRNLSASHGRCPGCYALHHQAPVAGCLVRLEPIRSNLRLNHRTH